MERFKVVIIECGVAWVPSVYGGSIPIKAVSKNSLAKTTSSRMLQIKYSDVNPTPRAARRYSTSMGYARGDGWKKNTLMFASDYPHWDYDAVNKINIPDDWKENVSNNALEVLKNQTTRKNGMRDFQY